jgi:hypothetical protein
MTLKIKAFAFLRRSPNADWHAFRAYFRGDFVKGVLATKAGASINRIVTNHVLEPNFRPTTNADGHVWSALAEYYFDDEETAIRTVRDPEFLAASTARKDMVEEISHTVVEEITVYDKDPRPGAPKVYGFAKITSFEGKPVSREDMRVKLFEHIDHMNEANYDTVIERLVQNPTRPNYHSVNPRYDYDAASLVWFDTIEIGESIYKNAEVEHASHVSTAPMGVETRNCMYLRCDEAESFRRT